jgi:hypothetical protein
LILPHRRRIRLVDEGPPGWARAPGHRSVITP